MLRQSPIHSDLHGKRVLLVDRCEATREVCAAVLQSHGVEVHTAADLRGARLLCKPDAYSWIFLDVRRHLPGEERETLVRTRFLNPLVEFERLSRKMSANPTPIVGYSWTPADSFLERLSNSTSGL